jgi:hypothetical protein
MAAPTITSLSPAYGPAVGGNAVVITGTNLTAATAVAFGATSITTGYVVNSATQITVASAPAGTPGVIHVTATTADGTSAEAAGNHYEYVGLFSLSEARTFDKAQLTNATTYPDATITAKEAAIRAKFERIIGVALITTASTEYYDGEGSDTLYLNHHMPWAAATPSSVTLTSVTVIATDNTETAFTATELADVVKYSNKLVRRSGTFTRGYRNIKVVYSHGYVTVPEDIKQAALLALLQQPPDGLVPSSVPFNAFEGADGTVNWSRVKDPARGRWYGTEAVDAVLREHQNIETVPAIL